MTREFLISKLDVEFELACTYTVRVLHRGVNQTLTELRSKFWITRGISFTKKLLYLCAVCKKLNARAYQYPSISQLPELRFSDNYPFMSTGVDHLGPLFCMPVYGKGTCTKLMLFCIPVPPRELLFWMLSVVQVLIIFYSVSKGSCQEGGVLLL